MNILIIDSGGRGYSIGWKLKQSGRVKKLFFVPGNAGTASLGQNVPIHSTDIPLLLAFAKQNKIDLTVVGPEAPLFSGIVDEFQAEGLRIFGPTKAAAEIEESKIFGKKIMTGARIPTADYASFSDYERALAYIKSMNSPCFVKANGPAAGKGAIQCLTFDGARTALQSMMVEKKFKEAGQTVLIEKWLDGDEISVHAVCDSRNSIMFPFARDHKRALDNDRGEMTGGMGAVAPVPMSHAFTSQVKDIVERTLETLSQNLVFYRGPLFPGIIATEEGPKVLEFNARFGDPETEVYMKLLETDLLDLIEASIDNRLDQIEIKWRPGTAVCVIMASGGYPGKYQSEFPITGIERAEKVKGVTVFHCGTAIKNGKLVTNGGRVLAVTCYAEEGLHAAIQRAYQAVGYIHFKDMHFRNDIGMKLLYQK